MMELYMIYMILAEKLMLGSEEMLSEELVDLLLLD